MFFSFYTAQEEDGPFMGTMKDDILTKGRTNPLAR
jgi:hypothetical protein